MTNRLAARRRTETVSAFANVPDAAFDDWIWRGGTRFGGVEVLALQVFPGAGPGQ